MPLVPERYVQMGRDLAGFVLGRTEPSRAGRSSAPFVQAVAPVDGDGAQAGIVANPLQVGGRIGLADGNLDAFSRLRVGLPKLRFSGITDHDARPLLWSNSATATGAASYSDVTGVVTLDVPAPGDAIVRQTKEFFTYRAGQGQLALITFAMPGVADEVAFVLRSSVSGGPVDRVVPQAAWSIDRLDGSGPSGITLDPTAAQILVVDFQALFVGRVRFGFDIDGAIVYAHEVLNANALDVPYIRHARLPLRYEASNAGGVVTQRAGYFDENDGMFLRKVTSAASSMVAVCATVIREGGDDEPGIQRSVAMNASYTATTTLTTVLGVRLSATQARAQLRASLYEALNVGAENIEVMLLLNPTVAGTATWKSAGDSSIAEVSRHQGAVTVDGDGDVAVGVVLAHRYVPGGTNQSADPAVDRSLGDLLKVSAAADGTRDVVWLAVRTLTATSAMRASLTFDEIR